MNQAIILAGGKGTRMNSEKPKVVHEVCGVSMIERVVEQASQVASTPIVVVGYKQEEVRAKLLGRDVRFAFQEQQLGTGHAVACAMDLLKKEGDKQVFVLSGDQPLVSARILNSMLAVHETEGAKITLGTVRVPNYEGEYVQFEHCGRILRNELGDIAEIVEYKDATDAQREAREVNVSFYCFDADWLRDHIGRLDNNNASNEYYITDLLRMAFEEGSKISSYTLENHWDGFGANTVEQLKRLEEYLEHQSVSV